MEEGTGAARGEADAGVAGRTLPDADEARLEGSKAGSAPKTPSLTRLLAGFLALPLLVLAIVTGTLTVQVGRMVDDDAWLDHTDQAIGALHDAQTEMLDEETGVRGFLLTRDASFLAPFREARVREKLAVVRGLVADNPPQSARVDALERTHEAWRRIAEASLGGDASDATQLPQLRARKRLMDDLRAGVDALLEVEARLRVERAERARASVRGAEVLTVLLLVGLGLILAVVSRRQVARIVETFGGALDAERRALSASETLVENLTRQESFRDAFLKMLGHDLRNPLTAVSMAASYAREQENPPKTKRMLDRIVSSSERMGKMVDQLIDLTRTRLGEAFPLTLARVDLGEVVAHVVEQMRIADPRHRFALTREGDLVVRADRPHLEQVLENLLGNASAHGEGDVEVAVRGEPALVAIHVRNEGKPIAPEIAAKLFDPFTRGPEDKMRSDGLGLGLYISLRIVEAHGGTMRVRSDQASGTTEVIVELPRSGKTAAA